MAPTSFHPQDYSGPPLRFRHTTDQNPAQAPLVAPTFRALATPYLNRNWFFNRFGRNWFLDWRRCNHWRCGWHARRDLVLVFVFSTNVHLLQILSPEVGTTE